MAQTRLTMPSDPASEVFFDTKRLTVDFRKRTGAKSSAAQPKALHVVIFCFGWLIEDRFFQPGTTITAGPSRKNTFRIPTIDLPDAHPLIAYGLDGALTLSLNRHFTGILQSEDKLSPLDTKGAKGELQNISLPRGSRGVLEHGTLRIYFEEIPQPDRVIPPPVFRYLDDPLFRRWLYLSLAIHLALLLLLIFLPAPAEEQTLETLSPNVKQLVVNPERFVKFTPPVMKPMNTDGLLRGKVGMEGEGARAAGEEGRRGRGVPGAGKLSTRDVGKTGVLSFFSKGKRSALSDLVGGSAIPGSVDAQFNKNARYGLPGERELREGKGLQGSGTGGGGLSTSIGQGLGTKGKGGGAKGPGLADFGTGRGDTAVSASIEDEEVYIQGSIPREVIAKIINDHIGEIKYCYEREVQKQPNLRGKITTDFIIGLQGSVTSARIKASSMGNANVEQCITGVLRRLQFPKPGGGVVEVIYPFIFRVAG